MDFSNTVDQINDVIDSVIKGGSRYQVEKVATIAAYAVISVASLIWAFSGGSGDDELGADFKVEELAEIDDMNLHLINDSDSDWTRVRVVINQKYLWTIDEVAAGSQKTLRPTDFEYYYYIPRPWGRSDWEMLDDTEKPGPKASGKLDVELVQINAREGHSDLSFENGKPVQEEPAGDNVATAAE
ncbi:MAG: hypothetical protein ACLFVJ_02190 [Persicimonas sp.]